MKSLVNMLGFLRLILFVGSLSFCRTEAGANQKMTVSYPEMYKGNKKGLLRQHRMVGEFLECTYIEHFDPNSQSEGAAGKAYYPGTGRDRSKSRVVSLESIDFSSKIINTLECKSKIIRSWMESINKTLKENMFSVTEVRGWRAMTRPQSLSLEADRILTILENKNSNHLNKVKEAVRAFDEYVSALHEAYSDFKRSEDRLIDASGKEELRTRAQVAVLNLGQKENKELVKFTSLVRRNVEDARESKQLMEKLFLLLSSESCSNRILQSIELVQICYFLLNGLNVLSVFEEQRLQNKFRRDMARRSLIYQSKIEGKTLQKYPKFSNAPNFKDIAESLLSLLKKPTGSKEEAKIKHEFIQSFDEIVGNFGIRCPYFLTSVMKSGNSHSLRDKIFDHNIVKSCKIAWKEISSYLYKEGQIIPSAAIRLALKKALNKHAGTVYIWPRNAVGLYKRIFNRSDFESSFDISDEKRFISTCSETVNSEIGMGTPHAVSLDEISIICFNFFNLLEFYTEQYNYGGKLSLGKDGNQIRATDKHVSVRNLPSKIKAKALDVAFSETTAGVIDFPPFKYNDLDRVVIGILAENFMEACIQRLETVLGKASKYRVSNPQTVCAEAKTILKDYNILSQNPDVIEGSVDIFEQHNILDTSLVLEDTKGGKSDQLDSTGYLKLIQSKLGSLQPRSQPDRDKDMGVSPMKQLDPVKAYNLIRKLHFDWMDQMRSDPRYKGFTDLELKNNSPWNKQIKLWHKLITSELPEVKYAASYLNNRPSRFPLISGDKRGKYKRITPLEELLNEEIDPKYRARYALVENGPFDEQDFYYDDQYDDVQYDQGYDEDSVAAESAQVRGYYIKGKGGRHAKDKRGRYENTYLGKYRRKYYAKQRGKMYQRRGRREGSGYYSGRGIARIIDQPVLVDHAIMIDNAPMIGPSFIDNGCKYDELPLNWGQRATILYENMIRGFKQVKYRGKSGPEGFVDISDICYILERSFKIKKNHFEDISKVNLLECEQWFFSYLSNLWPPFGSEDFKPDIKTLCWESGFRGWL